MERLRSGTTLFCGERRAIAQRRQTAPKIIKRAGRRRDLQLVGETNQYTNMENTPTEQRTAIAQKKLVNRLQMHVQDMDARIKMAQVEIREKQAAVSQLEKEKWALDREVDKIVELLSADADAMVRH